MVPPISLQGTGGNLENRKESRMQEQLFCAFAGVDGSSYELYSVGLDDGSISWEIWHTTGTDELEFLAGFANKFHAVDYFLNMLGMKLRA